MTTLINQIGPSDCVLASIAMAKGCETWGELWNEEDLATVDGKGVGDEEPWMNRAGFVKHEDYKRVYIHGHNMDMIKALLWKRRALVSVNSLNIDHGGHMIYWDGEKIFDPSTKRTFLHLSTAIITAIIIFKD